MSPESIIDPSRPSAGRIYDYLLGGHHNFDVDRQAADLLVGRLPFLPKAVRLQRWCLQDLAVELAERRGYDVIIDFASGLPTNDHIHHVVPAGTTVIYSDYDPVVVEYARQILDGTPDVHFFQADVRRLDDLLNRPAVEQLLRGRRNVAMVSWGVSSFLTDDDLRQAARYLYEWSGPQACWAFHAQGVGMDASDPAVAENLRMYAAMGTPVHIRTLPQVQSLLKPWQDGPGGFVDLISWHSLDQNTLSAEDARAWGASGGGFGAYLTK